EPEHCVGWYAIHTMHKLAEDALCLPETAWRLENPERIGNRFGFNRRIQLVVGSPYRHGPAHVVRLGRWRALNQAGHYGRHISSNLENSYVTGALQHRSLFDRERAANGRPGG